MTNPNPNADTRTRGELCARTIEVCAKVADDQMKISVGGASYRAQTIRDSIRALTNDGEAKP